MASFSDDEEYWRQFEPGLPSAGNTGIGGTGTPIMGAPTKAGPLEPAYGGQSPTSSQGFDLEPDAWGGYTAGQNGGVTPIGSPQGPPAQAAPQAQNYGAAPAGFDAGKWGDPNKSDPKYNVGHAVQQNPNLTAEEAARIAGPGFSVYGKDKLVDAEGNVFDFKLGAQAGVNGPQWTWTGNTNQWAADAASGGGGTNSLNGATGAGGAAGGVGGAGGGQGFGYMLQPWQGKFTAPDPNQINQDPYYQWLSKQGQQGIERGAAGRGTLLTGGTLKDLSTFNQGLAGSFGDRQYERARSEYDLGKGEFYDTQDRPFNKLSAVAGTGQIAGRTLGDLGAGYANSQSGLFGDQGNAAAAGRVGQANAWQSYLDSISGSLFR